MVMLMPSLWRFLPDALPFGDSLDIPAELVERVNAETGAEPWFSHAFAARARRRHVCLACRWLVRTLPEGATVFEPGCGAGTNLIWLAREGLRVQGSDLVPEALAMCRRMALHSGVTLEVWQDGELAGGLYGVSIGRAFFGESMFHRRSEASRAALAGLVSLLRQRGVLLLDCQMETPHMMGMGAELWPRSRYMTALREAVPPPELLQCPWRPWTDRYTHDGNDQWRPCGEDGATCGSFRVAEYA